MAQNELQQAITAIKAGDKKLGKSLISKIIQIEPDNEFAWLWLSACVDTFQEEQRCLQSVLEINPNNQRAKEWIERLRSDKNHPVETRCIFCDEVISPRATVCPYCRKSQNKNKEAGGLFGLFLGLAFIAIPFIMGYQDYLRTPALICWLIGGLLVLLSLVSLLTG